MAIIIRMKKTQHMEVLSRLSSLAGGLSSSAEGMAEDVVSSALDRSVISAEDSISPFIAATAGHDLAAQMGLCLYCLGGVAKPGDFTAVLRKDTLQTFKTQNYKPDWFK